jgi:glycosyltransferase involved in cell wall biosynthesis
VTVISSYTGKRLREYAAGAASVTIPFGAAAVSRLFPGEASGRLRDATDPFVLLFVGRLVKRKGVDILLRALSVIADDSRWHLRIVGGGPEKAKLVALAASLGISGRVTFDGIVDSDGIHDAFRNCDALVLPAIVTETGDTEGLGVVLIEAMGYAKPVIASSAGGIVDIVRNDDTGLLVPPGDADALASAIRRAMDDPATMATISRRGKLFAEQAFSWDTIVTRLIEAYGSATAKREQQSA